jgi:hypothetical protein
LRGVPKGSTDQNGMNVPQWNAYSRLGVPSHLFSSEPKGTRRHWTIARSRPYQRTRGNPEFPNGHQRIPIRAFLILANQHYRRDNQCHQKILKKYHPIINSLGHNACGSAFYALTAQIVSAYLSITPNEQHKHERERTAVETKFLALQA